jgi:hypothetical protein
MLQRLAIAFIVLVIVGWGASLTLDRLPDAHWPWSRAVDAQLDDGWRRTSGGWERLSPSVSRTPALPVPIIIVEAPQQDRGTQPMPDPRCDFHPAFLALLLLLGATSAFCLFPNEHGTAASQRSQSLF